MCLSSFRPRLVKEALQVHGWHPAPGGPRRPVFWLRADADVADAVSVP